MQHAPVGSTDVIPGRGRLPILAAGQRIKIQFRRGKMRKFIIKRLLIQYRDPVFRWHDSIPANALHAC